MSLLRNVSLWRRFKRALLLTVLQPSSAAVIGGCRCDYYNCHSPWLGFTTSIMLLRIRTNLGTWKHVTPASECLSNVAIQICQEKKCRITQAFSRDPTGKDVLNLDRSLEELGLTNDGDMIYCRMAALSSGMECVSQSAGTASPATVPTSTNPRSAGGKTVGLPQRQWYPPARKMCMVRWSLIYWTVMKVTMAMIKMTTKK